MLKLRFEGMNPVFISKAHRWLGIVAALQLFIWTGSGLFFAVIPIDAIRGFHLVETPASFRLGYVRLIPPSSLVRENKELAMVSLDQVRITQRLNTPIYLIETKAKTWVFNAETAKRLAPLTEDEANIVASNSTNLPLRSVTWVEAVEPGSEYRDGNLPAWKVELDSPDHAALWIDANSGEVRAVRTRTWRIYDFLWSLHIMDYQGRDNFNSWLLRGFALLGVVTIVSGVIMFVLTRRRKRRSSRSRAA